VVDALGLEPTNLLAASKTWGYVAVHFGPLQPVYQDFLFRSVQGGPEKSVPVAYMVAHILDAQPEANWGETLVRSCQCGRAGRPL
jgi:hypothetical protein